MAANTQAKQAARDPLSPAAAVQSTGAMDALLDKLRAAGPSSRDKRDARRRARLRQNGAVRAASITKEPETDGDGEKKEEETPTPAATSDDVEQAPMSPDITVTSADQPSEEDSLSKRTEEMLMRLRGDGADGTASAAGKGSMRDKRKERRRRNGSNVSMSSTGSGPTSLSLLTSPPVPPIPANIPGSPGVMTALGSPEGDDAVARAKSALMAMRRGSDTGSIESGTSEQPSLTLGALSAPVIIDDDSDQGPATPTTIISPPSPDPESSGQP
jgi:cytokinesis protein